jgi:hypothetical protein
MPFMRVGFDPKTEQLKSLTTLEGNTLSYSYDGFLLTETTWAGVIRGRIRRTYDNNFRVVGLSINGDPAVEFKHDADELLTRAGALILDRDPQTGFLAGTRLDKVTTKREYSDFGELKRRVASHDGKAIFVVQYERYRLGRIVKKVETIAGWTTAPSLSAVVFWSP